VADTYRITGTGDSILGLTHTRWGAQPPIARILTGGRYLNLEWGRSPYRPGLAGCASTYTAALRAIQLSQPDGWIILQDNGIDWTVDDDSWAWMWRLLVAATPTDRGICAVTPHWRTDAPQANPWQNATYPDYCERRRLRMQAEIFAFNGRRHWVHMRDVVPLYPDDFLDGQHPYTAAAQLEILRRLPD